MYRAQNGYRLVTVDTLYADIKDMIEQKFPRLDQDIIDDALAYARHQYTDVPLAYNDQVMERIHQRIDERIQSEYDKLIELMLVRERNIRSDTAQDLTSGFISLPNRPIEMIAEKILEIAEENRNKLIPQHLQFPIVMRYPITTPDFLYKDRVKTKQFWSLNYKLRIQILYMEKINDYARWTSTIMKMFDEIYRLAQLNLNANVLERLILDSVMRILDESSLAVNERLNFIQLFENTINNQENIRYCRIYQENLRKN